MELTQTSCAPCVSGNHGKCFAKLPPNTPGRLPCACVPCGQRWERDALGAPVVAVAGLGQIRTATDQEFGVECQCCEGHSATVARFNTRHGGAYLCRTCLVQGTSEIDKET